MVVLVVKKAGGSLAGASPGTSRTLWAEQGPKEARSTQDTCNGPPRVMCVLQKCLTQTPSGLALLFTSAFPKPCSLFLFHHCCYGCHGQE